MKKAMKKAMKKEIRKEVKKEIDALKAQINNMKAPKALDEPSTSRFGRFVRNQRGAIAKQTSINNHAVSVQERSQSHSRAKIKNIEKHQSEAASRLRARLRQRGRDTRY